MNITVEHNALELQVVENELILNLVTNQLNLLSVERVVLREKFYSDVIIEETPTGTIDGINCVFTTSKNFLASSTTVFLNGLRLKRGVDYTESGTNEITFSEAPSNHEFTDEIIIIYIEDIL